VDSAGIGLVGLIILGTAWMGTVQDLQAKLQQKQEGAIKHERALAYASSRQVAVYIEISALCDFQCSSRYVLP
jgi:hypothetical protein